MFSIHQNDYSRYFILMKYYTLDLIFVFLLTEILWDQILHKIEIVYETKLR